MQKITHISEEQCEYLERLAFEVSAYQDLLAMAMRLGLEDTAGYQKEREAYAEVYASYEVAKRDVVENVTGESVLNLNWSIDFGTGQLTYEVMGR